jgi:hypothetical protein
MGWLFVLMAAVAILIYGVLPFWASIGFTLVIAWCGWLLYMIFYRPDALTQGIRRQP